MTIAAIKVPTAGQRVGVEYGPGEFAKHNAGTVMTQVTNQWGTHALVMMDSGKIERCEGLNTGPGIGWHLV